jgi:dTDP-4-amino-4,6-dideoxygalactose transaminase
MADEHLTATLVPVAVADTRDGAVPGCTVPFARPDIADAEIAAVLDVLESGWLTTGPRVAAFEKAFASHVGAPEAVAVSSCTAGLHLALLAAGVGSGDEVVTTPLTFCATANTVIHCGARPVFADVRRDTGTLDPTAAAAALTSRSRAIVPVHYAGYPADPLAFRSLADGRGLTLIEDAAHAVDAAAAGRRIGTIADYTCFSFYATKNLVTGEGGMVTLAEPERAAWMRVAALHGLSCDAWKRYDSDASTQYDVEMAGFKYNMTDLQAAIGLVQLTRLTEMQAQRRRLWQRYDDALGDLPLVRPRGIPAGWIHARHLYTVLVDPDRCGWSRDALQAALGACGIGTSVHFRALHLHRYYAERFSLRRGMFPEAEYLSDHTLSLPFGSFMAEHDVDRVAEALGAILQGRPPRG